MRFSLILITLSLVASRATAANSLAGTYQDNHLAVTLEDAGDGAYRGSIKMAGNTYALTARTMEANKIEGSFADANGNNFPFTAVFDGNTLALTSGATIYRLSPAGGGGGAPVAGPNDNGPGPVAAQRHEYHVAPNNDAIMLMPELRDAPAPSWVKPGMRIVTYQADASIPGARYVMVQDPDGKFRNKATGQTVSFEENAGGGGHGFSIVNVLAVMPDAVVLDVRMFLMFPPGNAPVFNSAWGIVSTPSCTADLWVNPQVLGKYLDLNAQGISSSRVPYKAAGHDYNALWRQITSDGGATTLVYDIDGGLKLHAALCSQTAGGNVAVNGATPTAIGGMTNLSQITLAGVRQTNTPWTKGRLPKALENVHEMVYEGTQTTFIPGAPAMPAGLRSVFKITGRGDDFIQGERTGVLVIGNQPNDLGKTDVVSSPYQFAPMAIDPADLAKLRQGQKLDEDPTTKGVVSVAFIGRDRSGKDVVVISENFPGAQGDQDHQHSESIYDRSSGMLIGVSFNNPFLHQVNQASLKSVR